jgi:hypothetical protein
MEMQTVWSCMVKLIKEYRCIICFIKGLFQIGLYTRYLGGIQHLGSFSFPHIIDKRHHKLTIKIYVIEKEVKRYICSHCWNVFSSKELK